MKTKLLVLALATILLIIPIVNASESEYEFLLTFEDGTLDEWDFTDSYASATFNVTDGELKISGNYSCLSASGGGGQAQTYINTPNGTDYFAEFDICYKNLSNWLVYDNIKNNVTGEIYAVITPYSTGFFRVGYFTAGSTVWETTTHAFDDSGDVIYHIRINLNINNGTGSCVFIVNNTLIASYTGLSNAYAAPNNFYTLGQAGGGSDAYVVRDNIHIEVSTPFDANFWFIVAGVITFFFVSGFALYGIKRW